MKVIVTSQNPIKLASTRQAFEKVFPDNVFEFVSVSAPSWVPDQPMGDKETLSWAKNRVHYARQQFPDADYRVGLEWWISIDEEWIGRSFAWMVIASTTTISQSKTATLQLPAQIISLINEWKELGEADDIVFWQSNSKQKMGAVWLLTDGIIDRAAFYRPSLIFALVPHKNTELY